MIVKLYLCHLNKIKDGDQKL